MNSAAPTIEPASWPMARLIAPTPDRARATDVSALVQLATWSAIILRSCRKVRCSIATGAAANPLTTTLSPRTRTTGAAAGAPIAAENAGAPR
jgi:hypothetical protein